MKKNIFGFLGVIVLLLLSVSCGSKEIDFTEICRKIERDGQLNVLTNSSANNKLYDSWKGAHLQVFVSRIEMLNLGEILVNNAVKKVNSDSILAISFSLDMGSFGEDRYLEVWKKLDLTKYHNLKAVEIESYSNEALNILFEKLKNVPSLEYLFLNIDNKNPRQRKINIPEAINDFPSLKLLKFNFKEEYGFQNIVLPDNFHNKIVVDKIIINGSSWGKSDSYKKKLEKALLFRAKHNINKVKPYDENNYNKKVFGGFYLKKQYEEGIKNYKSFIKEVLSVKSLKRLKIQKAFIDSIPAEFGNIQNLKEVYFHDCFISYVPQQIDQLTELKAFKMSVSASYSTNSIFKSDYLKGYKEAYYKSNYTDFHQFHLENLNYDIDQKRYLNRPSKKNYSRGSLDRYKIFSRMPEVEFPQTIGNLKNLKTILLYNVALKNGSFPEFIDSKRLKNFIVIDNNSIRQFPQFVGELMNLETLIWRYSKVKTLPTNLNQLREVKTFNIDDNQLISLDNVLQAASSAEYFTYDINNIPYQLRKTYNQKIYGEESEEVITRTNQVDKIYEDYYLKRKHGAYKLEQDFKTVIATRPTLKLIFKNSNREKEFYHKDIKKEEIIHLVDECTRLGLDTIQFFIEDRLQKYSKGYPEFSVRAIDTLTYYPNDKRFWDREFHINTVPGVALDYGKLEDLRTGWAHYGQEGLNNLIRAKSLRFITIENIHEVDSIPECFCELTKLDSVYVYDPIRRGGFKIVIDSLYEKYDGNDTYLDEFEKYKENFRDRKLFDYPIKMPDCIKKMKFKQVSFPGTQNRDYNY